MQIRFKIVLFLLGMVCANLSYGHGDLHARIQRVSKEIKAQPDSAFLYLKRGKLYLQHHDYPEAITDFKQCAHLQYQSVELDYGFAGAYMAIAEFDKTLHHLNNILIAHPDQTKALSLKGKVMMRTRQFREAALLFDQVLQKAGHLVAEHYLDSSIAWEKLSGKEGFDQAEQVIQSGIQQLGPLSVFYERLVDLHRTQADYASALDYQTKIIDMLTRKENAFFVRAQIHLDQGNKAAAATDLENTLLTIQQLPRRIKRHKAIISLNQAALALLKTTNNGVEGK